MFVLLQVLLVLQMENEIFTFSPGFSNSPVAKSQYAIFRNGFHLFHFVSHLNYEPGQIVTLVDHESLYQSYENSELFFIPMKARTGTAVDAGEMCASHIQRKINSASSSVHHHLTELDRWNMIMYHLEKTPSVFCKNLLTSPSCTKRHILSILFAATLRGLRKFPASTAVPVLALPSSYLKVPNNLKVPWT